MNNRKVLLNLNEHRVKALEKVLSQSVEMNLHDSFMTMYELNVPDEKRAATEATIESDKAVEKAAKEAHGRFAVYHIQEMGADYYLTSERFDTALASAYRYRLYSRNEHDSKPQTFADSFQEATPITSDEYDHFCESFDRDPRITMMCDYNLDARTVCFCNSGNHQWIEYSLRDMSAAAFKAYRSDYYDSEHRSELFYSSLDGKELNIYDHEGQNEGSGMTM